MTNTIIKLLYTPTEKDWLEVKRRALVTVGMNPKTKPNSMWKNQILTARHSPIRYLRFSIFFHNIPSYVATHLARHVHAQPYIKSQRNDRQNAYDRNTAPQAAPVDMIWDLNAEELLIVANKRLCSCADVTTRQIIKQMCDDIIAVCPEFAPHLVPMCGYLHSCPEFNPCGRYKEYENKEK